MVTSAMQPINPAAVDPKTLGHNGNSHYDDATGNIMFYGLTKREYFAAMAMQGLCAKPTGLDTFSDRAQRAVQSADALIEALNGSDGR